MAASKCFGPGVEAMDSAALAALPELDETGRLPLFQMLSTVNLGNSAELHVRGNQSIL